MDLYVSILNQINFVDESFGVDLSKYEDFCMNTPHYMGFDIENYKEYLVKEKKFRKILFELPYESNGLYFNSKFD